ncbi:MAG: hypothetical protein J6126_02880 [Clostridia bacterium]|nr:hypothetical protein [Clostridia bacterium]
MTNGKKRAAIGAICVAAAAITIVAVALGIYLAMKNNANAKQERPWFGEYYDVKVAAFAEENEGDPDADVVFLGDSLTDMCELGKFYPEYSCLNRGISGDTTSGLKERLKVSAYDVNPEVIVLLIGVNDINGGKSLESIYANYEEIISGIKKNLPETKIVWCSLTPMGGFCAAQNDAAIECNGKIERMAKKYGCTFVDLYTPLFDAETEEIAEEYTVDGLHFSDEGYCVISAAVKEALRSILGY